LFILFKNHADSNYDFKVTFMINGSLITDNGKGITQFSRDMRSSNNLFHWVMQDNTVERNAAGGFHVSLPYVWQYNENFTHSLYLANNTFRGNKDFRYVFVCFIHNLHTY
jgi:hypothetical protein